MKVQYTNEQWKKSKYTIRKTSEWKKYLYSKEWFNKKEKKISPKDIYFVNDIERKDFSMYTVYCTSS